MYRIPTGEAPLASKQRHTGARIEMLTLDRGVPL